jgi:carbon-monoxide dehydrogenase small subunit
MIITFDLNGQSVETDSMPHRRAVDLLRETFQIRSINMNCSTASCGACLVLMDDRPIQSCLIPAFELRFKDVWTMEGLSVQKSFADIVSGFKAANVQLCSVCAPARALATEALLRMTLRPSAEQARESAESVNCGCSSTPRILDAILRSARIREKRSHDS